MAILVTGGAGYVGSVVVESLLERDQPVVVIDNLVNGHRNAVHKNAPFYDGSIGDKSLMRRILAKHHIDACMHFSAYTSVGESVENPQKYFENNVVQTLSLLDVLIEHGVKKFVFSSTCSTYGEPQYSPIDEQHPQSPTSPYGWSKFIVERLLESYDLAYGLKFVSLRYFNACGAAGNCGEDHEPETHLIPLVLFAAQGRIPHVSIFGDDYPTPDGTAIRDYIHVSDLSDAHLLALEHLRSGKYSEFVNLGNGSGYSVNEVIETARRVTGRKINTLIAQRRPGDPSKLVADAAKAREVLDWNPQYAELDRIIESAWTWHQNNQNGYADKMEK